ncbi:uncharacterized protein BCR38DRAFT_461904 [Pseudomassariella vexata]|uniref:Zn(2)-C6 fungal-type domain-containing protein n=1 Tax=Pseudomassariella vexata TaxID=1141098 RepID=A0A1Y2DAD7_9PEZI|nr:uncharacterized protein BCR38DRAFT_461904 [Pseudomassariella vexata]ORY55625.1 hypothetical protein BCR38DRAFT_461904 [Pseudomassariella vexata]
MTSHAPSSRFSDEVGVSHDERGRSASRSRDGCWTCRDRKAKKRCDEKRPTCGRCERMKLSCNYAPRPKLSERRRQERRRAAENAARVSDISHSVGGNSIGSLILRHQNPVFTLSLPGPAIGACSLILTEHDHEAIRFFRTAFAKFHHTKNPKYSLISIMFRIAEADAMVMHLVLSLGYREMELRRPNQVGKSRQTPLRHYSSALRLMADAIVQDDQSQDLDTIFTALWLMLLYEQQFGDASGQGSSKHLTGAALLLQHQGRSLLPLPPPGPASGNTSILAKQCQGGSGLGCLVWISLQDAAAASSGMGGQFNANFFKVLNENAVDQGYPSSTPVEAFTKLHRYSWGDGYPQSELLDDVENRNVFALLGQYPAAGAQRVPSVDRAIQQTGDTFTELMEVASELSLGTDNSHRLVANIRNIVPVYYAITLDFFRLTAFGQSLGNRQRHALREVMNLAFQSFKHDGEEAMTRITWPLFIVALETDDLLHRDWILNRFAAIGKYGANFERAHRFLVGTLAVQSQTGKRVDVRESMKNVEHFIL